MEHTVNLAGINEKRIIQPLIYNTSSSGNPTQYGISIIRYQITRRQDLCNLLNTFSYLVQCTQRIVIPNQTPYEPGGQNVTGFSNYPAFVSCSISLNFPGSNSAIGELLSYAPRTINSSVVTAGSNNNEQGSSSSNQIATGSSTSQTNSFGVSLSLGDFGDIPTGGVSFDYGHTWGSENSRSTSKGNDSTTGSQRSHTDSMSVKDWACYTSLDQSNSSITWNWAQEFPWDIIKFRNNAGAENITLPNYVENLLTDGTQAFPPSQLSQFGIDFVMKATWIVEGNTQITANHVFDYFTATHNLDTGTNNDNYIWANIDNMESLPFPGFEIDLCLYGLDPILNFGPDRNAIVGFVSRNFMQPAAPVSQENDVIAGPSKFLIVSSANNLMIQDITAYSGNLTSSDVGAGFTATATELTAMLTPNCTSLEMQIFFKIIDVEENYRLYLKHWKTGTTGVLLTITINGDSTNTICRYVDALEAEGGDDNLSVVSLRNLSFGSVDYHDYLQLGVNQITIALTPIGGNPVDCGYQIRAVSIER
jgi:hypothetical protein